MLRYDAFPCFWFTVARKEMKMPSQTAILAVIPLGREMRTLLAETRPAGHHQVIWEVRDNNGSPVSSACYVYDDD
jgi:hypothetical protein